MSNKPSEKKNKPLREISVEGCELIGKGGNGAVYRLDDETILKVYSERKITPEKINESRKVTRDAFVHGVPTMIAFDMVRVGKDYGVVYENINARSLGAEIASAPEKTDEYAYMIVDLLKKLQSAEFEKGTLPDSRDRARNDVRMALDAGCYKPAEAERLYKLIDDIPYRNTFVHQDLHPGNMMLQNGEIVLIDIDDSGLGHPILELSSMYLVYVTAAKVQWKTTDMGITKQQYARLWDIIVREFFGTNNKSEIAEINRIIKGYSLIKMIRGVATSPSMPNFLRKPVIAIYKRSLMAALDSLHPIP